MIDWVGGEQNLVGIIIPLSGICILLIIPKITETNRSRRYFLPAFIFWLGFQLLIGLEQGTLISFPHPIGLLSAGFLLFFFFLGSLLHGTSETHTYFRHETFDNRDRSRPYSFVCCGHYYLNPYQTLFSTYLHGDCFTICFGYTRFAKGSNRSIGASEAVSVRSSHI